MSGARALILSNWSECREGEPRLRQLGRTGPVFGSWKEGSGAVVELSKLDSASLGSSTSTRRSSALVQRDSARLHLRRLLLRASAAAPSKPIRGSPGFAKTRGCSHTVFDLTEASTDMILSLSRPSSSLTLSLEVPTPCRDPYDGPRSEHACRKCTCIVGFNN